LALGEMIRSELEIYAPRMIKHVTATECQKATFDAEFQKFVQTAQSKSVALTDLTKSDEATIAHLSVSLPDGVKDEDLSNDLKYHSSRYAPVGSSLQRTGVRFGRSHR
jgi:hypothetical protein